MGCQVGGGRATCDVICQTQCGNIGGQQGPCGTQTCKNGSPTQCSPGTIQEVGITPWSDAPPQYLGSYASAVQSWTGNLQPGCNNTQGQATTGNDPIWKSQSIVTGSGGAFSWPSSLQGLGGWACYTYQNTQPPTCFAAGTECPNNSGPEGEQFYIAVNNSLSGQFPGYQLTGVQECYGAEGVGDQHSVDPDFPAENGKTAIENHMVAYCKAPPQ